MAANLGICPGGQIFQLRVSADCLEAPSHDFGLTGDANDERSMDVDHIIRVNQAVAHTCAAVTFEQDLADVRFLDHSGAEPSTRWST